MIEKYIKDALLENHKVVVPNLGTFRTSFISADINASGSVITPPTSEVLFTNDVKNIAAYSLVDFIRMRTASQGSVLDVIEIEEQIATFVQKIKSTLEREETVKIDGFGYFKKGINTAINFSQFDEVNLLPDSFGLPKIKVQALVEVDNHKETKAKDDEKKPNLVLWLVLIPVLIVTAFVAYIFINPDAKKAFLSMTSSNNEVEATDSLKAENTDSTKVVNDTDGGKETPPKTDDEQKGKEDVTDKKEAVKETPKKEEKKEVKKPTPKTETKLSNDVIVENKTGRYFLIIGSFSTLGNAKKAVREANQKGYQDAKVMRSGSKFRVSISDYSQKVDASQTLKRAKKHYSGVWILQY